ncbi:MAG: hypothetical protein AAF828_01060 [Bacteroidota bacterium]
MLQFFRSNQLYAGLLLIFYALFLHLPAWWQATGSINGVDQSAGVFGQWLNKLLLASPSLNILVPVLILYITGIVANRLASSERLSRKITQFPGLFIILIGSLYPAVMGVHSTQIANLFLLISIIASFQLYQSSKTAIPAFNAGFWLGIASLFNATYPVFLLLLFVAAASLNTLSLKMIFRILAGFICPLWLVGSGYFLSDQYAYFIEAHALKVQLPAFQIEYWWNIAGISLLSGILGFVIFKQDSNTKLLNIEGRKKINILYWWLFITNLLLLVVGPVDSTFAQVLAIPAGILLSLPFSRSGRAAGEAGHLLIFSLALIFSLYPLLF